MSVRLKNVPATVLYERDEVDGLITVIIKVSDARRKAFRVNLMLLACSQVVSFCLKQKPPTTPFVWRSLHIFHIGGKC